MSGHKRLTKAQRRVLAGFLRTQRETLASKTWTYIHNYGQRGCSYYGIVHKLIRRGYISQRQIMPVGEWWILMHIVTDKGHRALAKVQP